jgi:hypothetical protein
VTEATRSPTTAGLRADPLRWLLQKSNPCVRYRTLTEILGRSRDDPEVVEARDATWKDRRVRRLLEALSDAGPFPKGTVWEQKLFKRQYGDLDTLFRMGVPSGHPAIAQACEWWLNVAIPPQAECYPKQMIGGLVRYAGPGDPRLLSKVEYVLENEAFFDGNRPGVLRYGSRGSCCGSHSCYSASLRALWAVMGVPEDARTPRMDDFLDRGRRFLRAHHLYLSNHRDFRPIKQQWLTLHLPFALGWETDILDILDVATQIGLEDDPCLMHALRALLEKQTDKGRWRMEARTHVGDGRLAGLVEDAESVGDESKWITLAALCILKRCPELIRRLTEGEQPPMPERSKERRFSDYPFRHRHEDENRIRAEWEALGMHAVLRELLLFKGEKNLKAGWRWEFAMGPEWCREWCAARVRWIPRKGDKRSWAVCRIYFLARAGQFSVEALSRRLGLPIEDEGDKARFARLFRNSFWRIRIARWKATYDEIAVTLRDPKEFGKLRLVMTEALLGVADSR